MVKIENDAGRKQGSGVIVKVEGWNGYVVTNHHVVQGATEVQVTVNDSDEYTGEVLGTDAQRDLAAVKICCADDFQAAVFADSEVDVQIGDTVFLMGYPVDAYIPKDGEGQPKVIVNPGVVSATITTGIVSAVRYDSENDVQLIQTDAPTNPGNSGGGLFSVAGGIVGIHTFELRGTEGLNFAILETTVQEHLPALLAGTSPSEPPRPQFNFVPVAGVWPGHIHNDADPFIESVYSNMLGANVIASARLFNPYSAAVHDFSHGFILRNNGQDPFFVFVLHSYGAWYIEKITASGDQRVAAGRAPGMRTGAGQANNFAAAAIGEYGWMFLNSEPLSDATGENIFHLGTESHAGWAGIVSGYFNNSERPGTITRFEDFLGQEVVIHRVSTGSEDARWVANAYTQGHEAAQPPTQEHQHADLE